MADNVFRIEVGANIGHSTNTIRQDINGIFKLINKTPQKITVSLNSTASRHQLTTDIEKLAKNLSPKVTIQLNGGGSLKSGSGQRIMQDINKITAAISRQQAAKITLHLDVAASQKAMMAELKKLNLGVQITPQNGGGNKKNPTPVATTPQAEYQNLLKQGADIRQEWLRKASAQAGLSHDTVEYEKLGKQIDILRSKYEALINTFAKTTGKKIGITDVGAIEREIEGLNRVKNAADRFYVKVAKVKDRSTKGSSWATVEENNYKRLASVVSGSSKEAAQFSNRLDSLYQGLKDGKVSITAYRSGISLLKKEMEAAGYTVESAGAKFSKMLGNRIGYAAIAAGLLAIRHGLNQIYTNVVSLDTAMTELKKVTNETDETYKKFLDGASARAKRLGATLIDTVNATASFARLGYTLNESADLADAALVYKNVGDGIANIDEASDSVIATMQAFQVEASDAMQIVDKFNEVGNNFAISSKGVGEALLRSAAAMYAANNTLDETVALAAAANTIVQDPEKVGTVMKTVSMFLRAAKTEAEEAGENTEGMADSVSKLREEILRLTGQKVDIQLDENTFKSTYQILKEISLVWDRLTDVSQANLLEMLGGKRNANVVAALVENFDIAEKALVDSQHAAGSALQENEKYLDSINGKIDQMKASFEVLSSSILSSSVVKGVIDALRTVLEFFNKLDAATGGASTKIVTIVSLFIMARGVISAFTSKVQESGTILNAFFGIFTKDGVHNDLVKLATRISDLRNRIVALVQAIAQSKAVAGFSAMSIAGKFGIIAGAIAALGTVIYIAVQGYRAYAGNLKNAKEALSAATEKVNELSSSIETNKARIEELQQLKKDGTINLVEQDELDKLERENTLLEQQLAIAKNLETERAKTVSDKAAGELQSYFNATPTYDSFSGAMISDSEFLKAQADLEKYREAEDKYHAEYLKGEEASQKLLSKYDEQRVDALESMSSSYEYITGLLADIDATDPANTELLNFAQSFLDQIDLATGGAEALGRVWNKIWSDDQTYPGITEVTNALKLAASTSSATFKDLFSDLLESGELDPVVERLKNLGIVIDDDSVSTEELIKLFSDLPDVIDESADALGSLTGKLEGFTDKQELIRDAKEEFKEYGAISSKTLSSLAKEFPSLSRSIDLYILGLKSGKDLLLELSNAYAVDVENYKKSLYEKVKSSPEFYKSLLTNQKDLVKSLSDSYNIDFKNFKTIEEAKLAVQSKIISKLATNYGEKYVGASLETLYAQDKIVKNQIKRTKDPRRRSALYAEMSDISEAILQMQALEDRLKKVTADVIDYKPVEFTPPSTSSKKSSEDKYKKLVDEKIAALRHQYEIEKITAQQFYDGLEKIEKTYYLNSSANKKKYAEEIRSIDKELFQGRREILDDWLNDQGILAEKAAASGNYKQEVSIYNSMLAKTKSMIDAAYKYGLDSSSDYIQELESKISDFSSKILASIKKKYDDFISYMDDFDLWKDFEFSKFDILKRELNEVIALYEKGLLTWQEYVEARNEIAKDINDTKKDSLETILDLTMEMIKQEGQDQVDALDKQIDAYQKIIDLKKKLLQDTSDEKKHEQEVAELVKSIAELQSKIAQLSLDDSREAAAKRAELEQQLHDKQKELADLQGDYTLDQTLDVLDKSQEAFEDEKDAEKDAIEDSIDSWQELYEKAIERINGDWDGLYKDLMKYEMEHRDSIDGPDSLVTAWKNATAAMQEYNHNFEDAYNSVNKQDWINPNIADSPEAKKILEEMKSNSEIAKQYGTSQFGDTNLHQKNQELAQRFYELTGRKLVYNNGWRLDHANGDLAYQIGAADQTPSRPSMGNSQTSGGSAYAATTAKYNAPPSGTLKLGSKGDGVKWLQYYLKQLGLFPYAIDGTFYTRTEEALKAFQRMAKLSPDGIYGPKTKAALPRYHSGGIVTDSGSIGNNEVLAILKTGEWVLDDQRKQNLKDMFTGLKNTISAITAGNLSNRVDTVRPVLATITGGDTFAPNINVSINHSGDMKDSDAKHYGQMVADTALDRLKNAFTKRGI